MPDSINYKKDNVYIAYSFTDTQRRYTGVNAFAGFIDFLAQSGYKLKTSGKCFSEGSSFPSQEHCNGRSVDTLYLGIVEQDQKIFRKVVIPVFYNNNDLRIEKISFKELDLEEIL
jgi:hypothetical protein